MLTTLLTGCELRTASQYSSFSDDESEYVLALVLDLSSSSVHLFDEDEVGFEFTMNLIDNYMRAAPGRAGRLILVQVSASDNPLLWEGNPAELRSEFSTAEEFRKMLMSKSNPAGSRIHEGLARTFEYLLSHRAVTGGAKPGVFVLSDMMDNGSGGAEFEKQLNDSLEEFGKRGGIAGFYFVDQSLVTKWERNLANSKIRDSRVTANIVAHPPLPSFD